MAKSMSMIYDHKTKERNLASREKSNPSFS